jgi:hypothetical protein
MIKLKFLFIVCFLLIILFSCPGDKYNIASFSETPINLSEFDSEYDDYNSTSPTLGETFPFCFSTTRESQGANYDIVYKLMSIIFSKKDGILSIYENNQLNLDVYSENTILLNALKKINTSYDELGPYLIPQGLSDNGTNSYGRYQTYIFLYSNNSNGNQDIFFTHNLLDRYFEIPAAIEFLNSEFDDAYPAFSYDFSELYFTSNRDGKFNIYKLNSDNRAGIVQMLSTNPSVSIGKDVNLSSEFDDKCPFISLNLLVFASNREGGFGGFDLYYSYFESGNWTTPKNFGEKINTSYDEYRPIVKPQMEFVNDFMVFSSNRPGGKGGFDLYFVGIDKIN